MSPMNSLPPSEHAFFVQSVIYDEQEGAPYLQRHTTKVKQIRQHYTSMICRSATTRTTTLPSCTGYKASPFNPTLTGSQNSHHP